MIYNYSLLSYGRVYNPFNWYYNPLYVVNRIYYIIGGKAFYKYNTPLKPGHMYIFKSLPEFRVHQDKHDPVDHVFFDFITYNGFINKEYIEIDVNTDCRLAGLMQAISEDFKEQPSTNDIAVKYLDILFHYLKDYLVPDNHYSDITKNMLNSIHNTPVNEISVQGIANEYRYNVNHIIRVFKKDLGITPNQYIIALKVNLAIAYIEQGLSCTDIAEKLGFGSISAFSYFFKQSAGMNYSDYKHKVSNASYEESVYYNV